MKLKEAKQMFEDIVELCYHTENPKLIEVTDSIYSDVEKAESLLEVISAVEELQIILNEMEVLPDEEDAVMEMSEMIEKLSE